MIEEFPSGDTLAIFEIATDFFQGAATLSKALLESGRALFKMAPHTTMAREPTSFFSFLGRYLFLDLNF